MFNFDFLTRLKSFLGLNRNYPQKKQVFNFFWEIEVFNDSLEPAQGELFLPLPLEIPSQKIIREPVFTPVTNNVATEENYHNRYASWHMQLRPGEKKSFFCQFQAETAPINFLPDKKFLLSDYARTGFENNIWLSANRFVQPEDPEIRKIARDVVGTEKDVLLIIKKLNDYAVNRLKYGRPILGLYSVSDSLKKEMIDCGGFASLLISLCLSLGIPARIVSGFWTGYPDNTMHVWAEIGLPDGSWIPADPTVENLKKLGRTKKTGRLGFIGSDRIVFSRGCDLEIKTNVGKIKVDVLQNPFYKGAQEEKIKINHNLKTKLITI